MDESLSKIVVPIEFTVHYIALIAANCGVINLFIWF